LVDESGLSTTVTGLTTQRNVQPLHVALHHLSGSFSKERTIEAMDLPAIEKEPKRMKTIAAGMLAKATERLQQLITLGELALVCKPPDKSVSEEKYQEWRLASLSFLQTVLGASNHYWEFFKGEIVPSPDGSKDYSIEEGRTPRCLKPWEHKADP
jgi:hypothetical protein